MKKGLPKLDDIQLQQEELPGLKDGGIYLLYESAPPSKKCNPK